MARARFSLTQEQQIATHVPAVRQVIKSKKSPAIAYLYTFQGYQGGEPYFRAHECSTASRMKPVTVAGVKVFRASSWSSYA